MVNVFGGLRRNVGTRGPRGPVGRTGRPGILDLSIYLPNTLITNLQSHDEVFCFMIKDLDKDIKPTGDKLENGFLGQTTRLF